METSAPRNLGGNSKQRAQFRKLLLRVLGDEKAAELLAPKPKPMPVPEGSKTLIYLRAFGVVGVLSGVGAMTFPAFFWVGVGVLHLAGCLWIVDLVSERGLSKATKLAIGLVVCALLGSFDKWVVFYPPQIEVVAHAEDGNYKDGQDIDGITWKPGYSELRVAITNHSNRDYENVDMRILPDTWVAKAIQTSHIFGVDFPGDDVEVMSVVAHGIDPATGKPFDQPLTRGPRNSGVRVHCPRLPKKTSLMILVATMSPTSPLEGVPDVPPKNKVRASLVKMVGDYTITWRPYHIKDTYNAH